MKSLSFFKFWQTKSNSSTNPFSFSIMLSPTDSFTHSLTPIFSSFHSLTTFTFTGSCSTHSPTLFFLHMVFGFCFSCMKISFIFHRRIAELLGFLPYRKGCLCALIQGARRFSAGQRVLLIQDTIACRIRCRCCSAECGFVSRMRAVLVVFGAAGLATVHFVGS